MNNLKDLKRITVPALIDSKKRNEKISALTAYDYTMARLLDGAGVEMILVGDSLSSVIQGNETTLPVTLDEMIYHCKCVARGTERALLVGDLPFLTYQVSLEQAILAAGRLLKEGGVAAVKLEGGVAMAPVIERLVELDIPVVGHVGLTPQSYHRMGGHKRQGRQSSTEQTPKAARAGTRQRVIDDALAVEEAGAFAIVLEGIPAELAGLLTRQLKIPTIGIAAGSECDGQILVINDLLGLNPSPPSFVKPYNNLAATVKDSVARFINEVKGEPARLEFVDNQSPPFLQTA